MCMEDVRLGRVMTYSETLVAVGVTTVPLVTGSLTRTMLVLGAPLLGTFTFSTAALGGSGIGLTLAAGMPPIILNIKDHGQMVTQPWNAICSGAGQTCYVGQGLLPVT